MHNRIKQTKPPTDSEIAALEKKSNNYAALVNIIFQRRESCDHSLETLSLVGKMIRNNPDFYTLWNFRREILFTLNPALSVATAEAKYFGMNAEALCKEELELSAAGIEKNPKSYCAWNHRRWIIECFTVDYQKELALCRVFLNLDQRNFHCWNYRRFVVETAGIQPQQELLFSAEKIIENFSNYSAFHHRSIYIKCCGKELCDMLSDELKIVEDAIFTEPDDQSAWWYHQFLLKWTSDEVRKSPVATDFVPILLEHLNLVRSLLAEETKCRWVMNSIILTINLLIGESVFVQSIGDEEVAKLSNERSSLLQKLLLMDPNHRHRYSYLLLLNNCRF